MAIKINGTTVVNDSRQLTNIASIDSSTAGAISAAGIGGSVNLAGATTVYNQDTETYTITNYVFDASYTVSVTSGSVSINNNTILYTAPTVSSSTTATLTVNQTKNSSTITSTFTINLEPIGIIAPVLTMPSYADVSTINRTYTGSTFSIEGATGSHDSSDWQLATDNAFSNVVASLSASTTSLQQWTDTTSLSLATDYYVRARYRNNQHNVVSDWSTPISFTTAAGEVDIPTISYSNGTFSGSAYSVTGQAPAGDSHQSTSWYVYSDAGATNLFGSVLNNTTYKTSIGFGQLATVGGMSFTSNGTYYVKAIYNSSKLAPSDPSNTASGVYADTVSAPAYPGGTIYNSNKGVVYYGTNYSSGRTASFTWRYFMGGAKVTVMGGGGGSGGSPVIGGAGGGGGNLTTVTMPSSINDGTTIPVVVGAGGTSNNGSYENYNNGGTMRFGGTGGSSSFGTYASATGGIGGTIAWEGGFGGQGVTGGGGSTQVNNGQRVGSGGYDGQADGQARNDGGLSQAYSGPNYTNHYPGQGGSGDQASIDAMTTAHAAMAIPASNVGSFSPTGNVGTNAPGSPGGAGVSITGVPDYSTPNFGGGPSYGSYYQINGNTGFGAGGRGALGDAGGSVSGQGSPGIGGFVAIEW
jgi:predicted secreted protein